MERKPDVIIRRRKQEQASELERVSGSRELDQIAELRQRFGITCPEQVAIALRIPKARAKEILDFGV